MKAVVLEIKNRSAAVLTEDGEVLKIRAGKYQVGQEIDLDASSAPSGTDRTKLFRRVAAAAVIAVTACAGLRYADQTVLAYSTVTVTTEDSAIELVLNKQDEVICAEADNAAGRELAESLHVSRIDRLPLRDAITEIGAGDVIQDVSVESKDRNRQKQLSEAAAGMAEKIHSDGTEPAEPEISSEEEFGNDVRGQAKSGSETAAPAPEHPDQQPDFRMQDESGARQEELQETQSQQEAHQKDQNRQGQQSENLQDQSQRGRQEENLQDQNSRVQPGQQSGGQEPLSRTEQPSDTKTPDQAPSRPDPKSESQNRGNDTAPQEQLGNEPSHR